MSNTNNNLQTQTLNALHNAIMEAGGKDRPPMLAPGNYNPPYKFKWTKKTVPINKGSSETTTEGYMENYKNVSQDIRDQLNAEAEAVQIIIIGIDNDIYSTVDACPNACEMWKAIKRLKQGESINVQDLETNLYWEFRKFTSRDGESLESYYSRFYKMMNALVRNQCDVTNHQVNVQFLLQLQPEWQRHVLPIPCKSVAQQQPVYHHQNHPNQYTQNSSTKSQQAATRNRGKEIVNSSTPTYDQEPGLVADADEMLKEKEIDKRNGYDNQRVVNVAWGWLGGSLVLLNADAMTDWRDDTDDEPDDQELEAHYMYMAHIQEVCDDDDDDLVNERDLLASLIDKLKCEIDDSKNRNNFLESSNKTLADKLKGCYNDNLALMLAPESDETIRLAQESHIIQNAIEGNFCPQIRKIDADLEKIHLCLKEEMVADLRYFNSLENEVDFLKSQMDTQRTQFLNEIDRLSREYYYVDHMNAILEQIKNDKAFKENQSNVFLKERKQYFEIQDLKAQLQDKDIAISELKKLIEKLKEKSVETKFKKPSVIRQPNAFKSQRSSVLGVIPTTSVSRPPLKSNRMEDRVMSNNSKGKKQEVEDHRSNFKFSNNKTSVTACNDSLNAKTSNVNFVCVTCGKCVLNGNHDMCVLYYINGVNSRTRQPIVVPISTREPKRNVDQSVLIEIILFIIDSGCSKHMTGNLKILTNFVEKFLGTVKFGNDQIAPILGYEDLVQGKITNKRVYYIEGLNHNLFFVGQFCDADLEVAFQKSTFYIRDLKGNDLLTGSRGTDLYSITLQYTFTPNPICLMAKATSSQAWLWHRRLSHLNFDTINLLLKNDIVIGLPKLKFVKDHLCSSCELGKAKRKSFHTKTTPSSKRRLQILHMDLCGPMRVESFNGKKYVLVIVDDYSIYTWTHLLRSNDETPKVLIDFLRLVQRGLHT
ncbi:retrovirus-related pol polyprotein from transposon TNT 1-94 [Tanacetum coccineum]